MNDDKVEQLTGDAGGRARGRAMTGRIAGGHLFVALAIVISVAVVGTGMAGSTTVGPFAATGVIVAVPGSNLVDGETFTIDDGAGGTTTFEFDSKDASGATLGEAIPFAESDTASQVADQIRNAVSGAAQLQVSANSTGPAVWLTNDNVGSAGNMAITETVSNVDFLVLGMSGGTETTTTVGPLAATGVIVAVPGSNLVDGETFTIDDGAGGTTTFEFDSKDASGVTLGEAIPFAESDTASQVADQIRNAVSGAAQLQVSANSTGPAVWLTNDNVGSAGNMAITETVSTADFLVVGMSGGTNDTAPSDGAVNDGLIGDGDRQGDASVLEANWSRFTDDVGVDHYEYSASTSATCNGDVVRATNVGTATSYTATASLSVGTTYYSCVRAYDASGNPSAWVASDGVELASGTLTVTSAVKAKGTIMVTFSDSANTPWIAEENATTPFECDLGPRGAWVPCASGDTFKSSAKSVTVRGYLDVDPALLVQSSPYTLTR